MIFKKIISIISLTLTVMCIFTGCSPQNNISTQSGGSEIMYSRERVNKLSSRAGFGYGRTDVEILIMSYAYSCPTFIEKYGVDFCIDKVGGSDTTSTFFISWLYEGTAKYFVEINGDRWCISAEKSCFEKWKVVDYYQEQNE